MDLEGERLDTKYVELIWITKADITEKMQHLYNNPKFYKNIKHVIK